MSTTRGYLSDRFLRLVACGCSVLQVPSARGCGPWRRAKFLENAPAPAASELGLPGHGTLLREESMRLNRVASATNSDLDRSLQQDNSRGTNPARLGLHAQMRRAPALPHGEPANTDCLPTGNLLRSANRQC